MAAGAVLPTADIEFPPAVIADLTPPDMLCVTVDDGWNPMVTKVMLENLYMALVKSTWFLVGQATLSTFADDPTLDQEPRDLRRENRRLLYQGGHEIGYHSMRHEHLVEQGRWTRARWQADYDEWHETVQTVFPQRRWHRAIDGIGSPKLVPYARAPYGAFTDAFLSMCEDNDLIPIGWSNDLSEWKRGRELQNGQILLVHTRLADLDILAAATNRARAGDKVSSLSNGLRSCQQTLDETVARLYRMR